MFALLKATTGKWLFSVAMKKGLEHGAGAAAGYIGSILIGPALAAFFAKVEAFAGIGVHITVNQAAFNAFCAGLGAAIAGGGFGGGLDFLKLGLRTKSELAEDKPLS